MLNESLKQANLTLKDIDAIAVTYGAGLIGALMVGVGFAKSLAYSLSIPLVAVNHIKGHVAANYIEKSAIENHNKWSVLYEIPYYGTAAYGAYYNEISLIKQWIIDRMEWLKGAYEQL